MNTGTCCLIIYWYTGWESWKCFSRSSSRFWI